MESPSSQELHVVTGAFGFSGKYIARRLLDAGCRVRTLTNSPRRMNPFGDAVEVHPFNFDDPEQLAESLRGAKALYNTYWVRFNHRTFQHASAVENTIKLFRAAKNAGVGRVVHVSITNPSIDSPLEYFYGKARLERTLIDSGLSHAILRPAVLFGPEDILINNIAWALRKFPVMMIFGNGEYRLQPIYVDDLAKLAVEQGGKTENAVINAIGPETFTYRNLVRMIGQAIGKNRPLLPMPPLLGYLASKPVGWWVGDIMLTRDEIRGLMANLLCVNAPPAGETKLSDWTRAHAAELGVGYASELSRRKDREKAYTEG
ncbi:MAG: NAD(P)H-binding protein [Pirellulales bacterium]|nr:NAD(P)H-binding protein [Pirellulales bacterium]